MTRSRLKEIVRRIRYKPGWKIRVDDAGDVEIVAQVPCAYHPSRRPVDPPHAFVTNARVILSTRVLLGEIFDACQRLEFHETAEWFRYRGRRPFDPHR